MLISYLILIVPSILAIHDKIANCNGHLRLVAVSINTNLQFQKIEEFIKILFYLRIPLNLQYLVFIYLFSSISFFLSSFKSVIVVRK